MKDTEHPTLNAGRTKIILPETTPGQILAGWLQGDTLTGTKTHKGFCWKGNYSWYSPPQICAPSRQVSSISLTVFDEKARTSSQALKENLFPDAQSEEKFQMQKATWAASLTMFYSAFSIDPCRDTSSCPAPARLVLQVLSLACCPDSSSPLKGIANLSQRSSQTTADRKGESITRSAQHLLYSWYKVFCWHRPIYGPYLYAVLLDGYELRARAFTSSQPCTLQHLPSKREHYVSSPL